MSSLPDSDLLCIVLVSLASVALTLNVIVATGIFKKFKLYATTHGALLAILIIGSVLWSLIAIVFYASLVLRRSAVNGSHAHWFGATMYNSMTFLMVTNFAFALERRAIVLYSSHVPLYGIVVLYTMTSAWVVACVAMFLEGPIVRYVFPRRSS